MSERKVALVIHGMTTLGTAICRRLHADGYRVVATYAAPRAAPGAWLATQRDDGYALTAACLDTGDSAACAALPGTVLAAHGRLDVLVQVALLSELTTGEHAGLDVLAPDQWRATRRQAIDSVFHVTRHALAPMLERQWGRIIQVAAGPAWPLPGEHEPLAQAMVNGALQGWTRALALEMARHGITVNTVVPGFLREDDNIAERGREATAVDHEAHAQRAAAIVPHIPVGRLGTAEEVAALVAYLASDSAAFVTGARIAINGGQHMV